MTRIGPPKLAPKDVPPEAALYLDNAAEYLKAVAKKYRLALHPYEEHRPEHSSWFHGLYGEVADRQFCLRVMTDEELAPSFTADLIAYVRLYLPAGQIVFPDDGHGDWLIYARRRVIGMAALTTAATEMSESLRVACVLRMPHPTDPDPKA